MLNLWGMWSTPSLPLLLGPLWPGMVGSYLELTAYLHLNELVELEIFLTKCTYI